MKDAVDLTPIPCSLQNIIKLIQAEEVEHQRPSGSLETGPCLEYLLQKRVLEELVEFAKVDVNKPSLKKKKKKKVIGACFILDSLWYAYSLFTLLLQPSYQR